MIKSVIFVTASVFLLILNTIMICLKSTPVYAKNDKENYSVFYQKWIKTVVFMSTIVISLFCIYFAINFKHIVSEVLLVIQCLLVVIYALCKYKCININGEKIVVERLFQKPIEVTYSDISQVTYIPNAKILVKLKKKKSFDVSFNSENFHRFFVSLMMHKVKFKTDRIPKDEDHVFLSKYNMIIDFPKPMFREFYQGRRYFHNSNYLFSARNLEKEEYIEGYYKESNKDVNEFVEIVKTDLSINNFSVEKEYKDNYDGYDFMILICKDNEDSLYRRCAYIYKDVNNYFVLYCDYQGLNEETFLNNMKNNIRKGRFEDVKSGLAKI